MTLFLFTHFIFILIIIIGDNMKVYMRNKDLTSSIGTALSLFVLLLIPILIIVFKYIELGSFKLLLEKHGSAFPFIIVFIVFDLYVLFAIFKPARKYVGKLLNKEEVTIKGKTCYLLTFEVEELYLREMYCYTKKENPFEVGKKYNMTIKELNWRIKKVDTEVVTEEKEQTELSRIINHPLTPVTISMLMAGFIFGSFILLCLIGLIFYTDYALFYILTMVIMGGGLFIVIKTLKEK